MSAVTLHLNDLELHRDLPPMRARTASELGYIRIRRGVYVHEDLIPNTLPRWDRHRLLATARALALSKSLADHNQPVFTLEMGLALHGMGTFMNVPNVSYRRMNTGHRNVPVQTGVIRTRHDTVASVLEHELQSAPPMTDPVTVSGVLTLPPWAAALDCARYLHPLPALVAVSSFLRDATNFSCFDLKRSRSEASHVKARLQQALEHSAHSKFGNKAAQVIQLADPGVANPDEGQLLWTLGALLSGTKLFDDISTQHPVSIGGRQYFIDVALPSIKFAFEADGTGKVTEAAERSAFLQRQQDLQAAGWSVVRISHSQFLRPEEVMRKIQQHLRNRQIFLPTPTVPLWQACPTALFSPAHRF